MGFEVVRPQIRESFADDRLRQHREARQVVNSPNLAWVDALPIEHLSVVGHAGVDTGDEPSHLRVSEGAQAFRVDPLGRSELGSCRPDACA